MRAAVLHAVGDLRYEDIPVPKIAAAEVLVRVRAVGVCGSDIPRVMKKGTTSGNVQKVKDILVDCDSDAVLYLVKPSGPACHLGEETCFHNKLERSSST